MILPVQDQVDDLLADGVVAPGVVVGRVLLPRHQLLRVEQLAVRSSPNLNQQFNFNYLFSGFKETVLRDFQLMSFEYMRVGRNLLRRTVMVANR